MPGYETSPGIPQPNVSPQWEREMRNVDSARQCMRTQPRKSNISGSVHYSHGKDMVLTEYGQG